MFGIILIVALLIYVTHYYWKVSKYPKGPLPLPFIGNLYQVRIDNLHLFFEECYEKYGDVFTVFTPKPMVVIMEFEHIKEALINKGDTFLGRHQGYPERITMVFNNGGITFAEGENWKRQRKTALYILKKFGMGKGIMEEQVRLATLGFIDHLSSIKDKDHIDFRWPLQIFVANVINKMLFNYEYDYGGNSTRLMRIADLFTFLVEDGRKNPLVFFTLEYPWIKHIPILGWYSVGKYRAVAKTMHNHIRKDMAECMIRYDPDQDEDCIVHAYKRLSETDDELTDDQLVNVCLDLFLAGMETVSTTLRWAMLLLAKHQHVQDKIRDEIRTLYPLSGIPSMGDRHRLPYTIATINEIQRVANILPQFIAKRTLNDVEIAGKFIPEDTLVQAQCYNVHKFQFDQPDQFIPERFLNNEGRIDKEKLEKLNPFGMGKRICAGETLARCEMFMLLTSLLSRFHLNPPFDKELDLTPINAIFLLPQTNLLQILPLTEHSRSNSG